MIRGNDLLQVADGIDIDEEDMTVSHDVSYKSKTQDIPTIWGDGTGAVNKWNAFGNCA